MFLIGSQTGLEKSTRSVLDNRPWADILAASDMKGEEAMCAAESRRAIARQGQALQRVRIALKSFQPVFQRAAGSPRWRGTSLRTRTAAFQFKSWWSNFVNWIANTETQGSLP